MNKDNNYKNWTPDWAKKVVWYQIFPERFRNGDLSNDPKVEDIKNSWPHDYTSPWQVHPWTSDWYKLQDYEKENGKDIWFNLQRRRYGGDLKGIIDKLDYIKELGIGAIYLNPVFESPSLHKYDGATYHRIDSNFGPDPEGDRKLVESETPHNPSTWVWTKADKLFLELVKKVHERDMKIIIDGVFNHMGLNSWAFKNVQKHQQNSPYKDWFKIRSWEDSAKGTKFEYDGWWGVKELPELKQDSTGIVEGPKKYIFDITNRWMNPDGNGNTAAGIDGWRLDVAFLIAHPFWKDWRKHVKSINPEAYLTAEIIDTIPVNQPYLKGDEFDAVMNYNFTFSCSEYFASDKTRISTTKFDKDLKELRKAFPMAANYVLMNLLSSHDTNRIGSHLVNKDLAPYREWPDYYELSKGTNPKYNTRKPSKDDIAVQKLMAIMQMTYLGAPMVYYGDEVGMWGANDPDCRKPMLWDDLEYEDEATAPDQTKYSSHDKVEINSGLLNHYKKMIGIRNEHISLQLGNFETLLTDNENEIYSFKRLYNTEEIIVVLNNSKSQKSVELNLNPESHFTDLLNNEQFKNDINGILKFNIKGVWGRILLVEK